MIVPVLFPTPQPATTLQPPEGKLGRLPEARNLAMAAAYAASTATTPDVAAWFGRKGATSTISAIKPLLNRFKWLGAAAVQHLGVIQDSLDQLIHIE